MAKADASLSEPPSSTINFYPARINHTQPSMRGLFFGASMYLTTNPHADAEGYFSDMQEHTDRVHSIETEVGSALRSALAWGGDKWLGLRSIRDRTAGEVIAELAATEEGCEAITKALSTLAQITEPEAQGAIWSLSDVWIAHIKTEIESC